MARKLPSRQRPAFLRTKEERRREKRNKRRKKSYMAVGETLSDKNESVWFQSQSGFVVIVEQDGWNRIKRDGASHHLGDTTASLSETSEQQKETIADY
ncbi:hypothetical protein QQF64_031679 [Cirrhinus molitorella]|uniref:Uncharacterized protein n=1 Tax=Cirrhinus molitorella TaxID=172907 RepID=A0ABR3MXM5_9TELE